MRRAGDGASPEKPGYKAGWQPAAGLLSVPMICAEDIPDREMNPWADLKQKGRQWAPRSGHRADRVTRVQRRLDEFISGIIDTRRAGIRDERYVPPTQSRQDRFELGQFVVFEIAGQRGVDVKMRQQLAGMAGILGGDEMHFAQNAERPRAHVLEVSNGSSDQIKRAHAVIVSLRPML